MTRRAYKTIEDALAGKWKEEDRGYKTPCHIWQRFCDKKGYGQQGFQNRCRAAHRLAYIAAHGPIPKKMLVHHECDVPPCINPDHLRLVTIREHQRLHAPKLTEQEVLEIQAAEGTHQQIAQRYGLSKAYVSQIKRGDHWTGVRAPRRPTRRVNGSKIR